VWVNTDVAREMKMKNSTQDFRRWIKPLTAHNEKMGVNNSVLLKKLTHDAGTVRITANSSYDMFNKIS